MCRESTEPKNQLSVNLFIQAVSPHQLVSLCWRYKDEDDIASILQELPGQQGRMTMNSTFKLYALYQSGLVHSHHRHVSPCARHPTRDQPDTPPRHAHARTRGGTTGGKGKNESLGTTAFQTSASAIVTGNHIVKHRRTTLFAKAGAWS